MPERNSIKDVRITHYSDNGQTFAYVHWFDNSVTGGKPDSPHMKALIARAKREGKPIVEERT